MHHGDALHLPVAARGGVDGDHIQADEALDDQESLEPVDEVDPVLADLAAVDLGGLIGLQRVSAVFSASGL